MTPIAGLRDFIERGCDARTEDRHHALQYLDQLEQQPTAYAVAMAAADAAIAALWDIIESEPRTFDAALKRGRKAYDKYRALTLPGAPK